MGSSLSKSTPQANVTPSFFSTSTSSSYFSSLFSLPLSARTQLLKIVRMTDTAAAPAENDLRSRKSSSSNGNNNSAEIKTAAPVDSSSFMTKAVQSVGPVLTTIGNISDALQPYVVKVWGAITRVRALLQQYHVEEIFPALLGLILAFFGGQFVLTIATVEAFRIGGWEKTRACLIVLRDNYQIALEESRKDDVRDDDNDGVADVKQITAKELASRKMLLFLRVCDPLKVSEALNGLSSSCCAVLATLRIQFARVITLGVTIGNYLNKATEGHVRGPLEQMLPPEHHKWITPAVGYLCKTIGISLAWVAGRFLAALQSGLRGGQIFTRALLAYLKRAGHMTTDIDEKDPLFIGIALAVAVAGIWWQLKNFFRVPFPFNFILFPLSIVEWMLSLLVGDLSTPAA